MSINRILKNKISLLDSTWIFKYILNFIPSLYQLWIMSIGRLTISVSRNHLCIANILTQRVALIAECCPDPGKDSECNVGPSPPRLGWIDRPGRSRLSAEITRTSCVRNSQLPTSDYFSRLCRIVLSARASNAHDPWSISRDFSKSSQSFHRL